MEIKSDYELIQEYLSGNEDALKEIIERHYKMVYRFLFNLTHGSEESSDLTQEVFVKVWKKIKRYDKKYNFKTWVFTIARNTAIDFFRKKKSLVFSDFDNEEGGNPFADTLEDESALQDDIFAGKEDSKKIKEIIEDLPLIYKEILLLRYEEELDFEEISKVLKRPIETVRSQHRRAVLLMKKRVNLSDFN